MVNEFPQVQALGEGGREDRSCIGHQTVVGETGTDVVGMRVVASISAPSGLPSGSTVAAFAIRLQPAYIDP